MLDEADGPQWVEAIRGEIQPLRAAADTIRSNQIIGEIPLMREPTGGWILWFDQLAHQYDDTWHSLKRVSDGWAAQWPNPEDAQVRTMYAAALNWHQWLASTWFYFTEYAGPAHDDWPGIQSASRACIWHGGMLLDQLGLYYLWLGNVIRRRIRGAVG